MKFDNSDLAANEEKEEIIENIDKSAETVIFRIHVVSHTSEGHPEELNEKKKYKFKIILSLIKLICIDFRYLLCPKPWLQRGRPKRTIC